jgi:hypothetical protein
LNFRVLFIDYFSLKFLTELRNKNWLDKFKLKSVIGKWAKIKTNARNANWAGRLSSINLLTEVACFIKNPVIGKWAKIKTDAGNAIWAGRLSSINLLTEVACFMKKPCHWKVIKNKDWCREC